MSERLFDRDRFYCGHCPVVPEAEGFRTVYYARQHVEVTHGVKYGEQDEGQDFYQAWQAQRIYDGRCLVADGDVRELRGFADPHYSLADFLADCETRDG